MRSSLTNDEHACPGTVSKRSTRCQETLGARYARYEQMVRNLYRYQAGTIALLEMLAEWARQELVESAEASSSVSPSALPRSRSRWNHDSSSSCPSGAHHTRKMYR